jgi:hypothetical protein
VIHSKGIQQPQNYSNDDDAIQDRFDGSLHWEETVYEPQQDSYYDQRHDNLNEWHMHIVFSFRLPGLIGIYK